MAQAFDLTRVAQCFDESTQMVFASRPLCVHPQQRGFHAVKVEMQSKPLGKLVAL
jgi:hypothetical protein